MEGDEREEGVTESRDYAAEGAAAETDDLLLPFPKTAAEGDEGDHHRAFLLVLLKKAPEFPKPRRLESPHR